MIDYNFAGRLQYIPGGPVSVQMSAWPVEPPAPVGNWWEPTTGLFTCLAAYQPKGAADLAASYINLANPGTNDAAPGDAPTFNAATGWTFNGSNDYLLTGITPATGYTLAVRIANYTSTSSNRTAIGSGSSSANGLEIRPVWGSGSNAFWVHGSGTASGAENPTGVLVLAGQSAYLNGVLLSSAIGAATLTSNSGLTIGVKAYNSGATRVNYLAADVLAVAIYSTTLDATQVAEVSAAMAAL